MRPVRRKALNEHAIRDDGQTFRDEEEHTADQQRLGRVNH